MNEQEKALHTIVEKAKKYDELIKLHNKHQISCSFCEKRQDYVKKLIAGPGIFICNECITLCGELIEEEPK